VKAGRGEVQIDNGSDQPAEVKLIADGRRGLVRHVFVAARSSWSGGGIPPGSYRVLFAQGGGWDATARTFTCERTATEFKDPLVFRASSMVSDKWTLSLQPVLGGTARTDFIAASAFDQAGR